jgi:hypothetical protein
LAQRRTASARRKGRRKGSFRALDRLGKIPGVGPLRSLIDARLGELRVTVRRNLAAVSVAVMCTLGSVRSGNGKLSLSALARCLPTEGVQKTRYKRLGRFLDNKHFCPEGMIPALVGLVVGSGRRRKRNGERLVPILVDQADIGGTPTIMAGVLHRGRVLPIGFTCVEYPTMRRSLNTIETALLTLIVASLPRGVQAIFTADRAYGRYQLICALNALGQRYILRCKDKVTLWHEGKKRFPKDFTAPWDTPVRYANVRYRQHGKEPVDLIVYRGSSFKETWYLLVPAGSEKALPTREVVEIYRSRMRIEQGFRDWKTHLGVRGLKLESNRAVRMGRLLLALALAYICLLLLGSHEWVQTQRLRFETLRRKPRHGTRRTLSVLSHAMLFLAAPDLATQAASLLLHILAALTRGEPAYQDELALEAPA